MIFTRFPLLLLFVIQPLLIACQKAVPEIDQLRSLGGFKLDQNSTVVSSKLSPAFSVSGICDSKFDNVEVSVDGGQSWQKISTFTTRQNISCSAKGSFQAHFDFSNSPLDAKLWSDLGSFEFLFFRGTSELGHSSAENLRLETASLKQTSGFVSGGKARESLTGGYQLSDRFFHVNSSVRISSGYKLEGTLTW